MAVIVPYIQIHQQNQLHGWGSTWPILSVCHSNPVLICNNDARYSSFIFLFFRNIFNFYRQIWCTNWHNATLVHNYYFSHIYNWYGNIYIFKMSIFYHVHKNKCKKKLSKIVNVWELKPKWLNLYTQIHIGNVMELKNKTKFKYIKSF